MSLKSNPFYVLGAAPSDDRRRIMALANNRRLDGDEAAIREARIVLTTPRKRLAAEIAWLPGLEKDEIQRALAAENEHPGVALRMTDLPALAHANLMADGLVEADPQTVSNLAAWWIVELAATHDRIRADRVTTAVNEARLAAGVPMASQQDVVEELRGRHNHFRDAMERCLDGLAFERMVEVVTLVVNRATLDGARHAPSLIDSLVDSYYERRVHEKMAAKRQEIGKLVFQVRRVGGDVAGIVAQLERAIVAWDVMAQPTQISLASRGMSHSPSDEIMRKVRSLAVELFNKHGLLEVAQRLTKTLREVFAEMEPITEILDKDVSALDEIAKRVEAVVGRGSGVHTGGSPAHAGGTRAARKPGGPHQEHIVHEKRRWRVAAFFAACAFAIWILVAIASDSNRSTRSGSSGMSRSMPGAPPPRPPGPSSSPSTPTRPSTPAPPLPPEPPLPPRPEVRSALRPAPPTRSETSSTNFDYSMPPVGTDDVHSLPEIRWCLRQDIRIETWRPLAVTNRQIAAFNQVVDDYNGRCGSYRYYQESMTTAQRDIASRRTLISVEARRSPPWSADITARDEARQTAEDTPRPRDSGDLSDRARIEMMQDLVRVTLRDANGDTLTALNILHGKARALRNLSDTIKAELWGQAAQLLEGGRVASEGGGSSQSPGRATSEAVHEAAGRGPDVVAITLPAGRYTAVVGVTGNGTTDRARVSAESLSYDSSWLGKYGNSVRGVKSFSLAEPEVLYVDVDVLQDAQWTIRIERVGSRESGRSSRPTRTATSEVVHEAAGRGPDVVAITLPAGRYAAVVGITGNGTTDRARVSAESLSYDSSWLGKYGNSVRGVKSFSLAEPEVLYVDVDVLQNAQWTIRIEKIVKLRTR